MNSKWKKNIYWSGNVQKSMFNQKGWKCLNLTLEFKKTVRLSWFIWWTRDWKVDIFDFMKNYFKHHLHCSNFILSFETQVFIQKLWIFRYSWETPDQEMEEILECSRGRKWFSYFLIISCSSSDIKYIRHKNT